MRSDTVFLQEQALEMLHRIPYGGSQIGNQQRFGKMLVDQADGLLQCLVTDRFSLWTVSMTVAGFAAPKHQQQPVQCNRQLLHGLLIQTRGIMLVHGMPDFRDGLPAFFEPSA
ncbi:hypothetical protein D3C80_1603710 [compost metagenome]